MVLPPEKIEEVASSSDVDQALESSPLYPLLVQVEHLRPSRSCGDMFRKCSVRWTDSGAAKWYDCISLCEFGVFTIVRGTAISSPFLYVQTFIIILLQWLVCAFIYYTPTSIVDPAKIDTGTVDDSRSALNTLVAFLLGLFVSKTLDKWMQVRSNIGGVWGATCSLATLLSVHLPDVEIRQHILRLCVASHCLVVKSAQGSDDLADLVEHGYLTKEEATQLGSAASKCQQVWVWVYALLNEAKDAGYLKDADPQLMFTLRDLVLKGSGSAGGVLGAINTMLPLFYVHAVCMLVKVYFGVSAVLAGINTAAGLEKNDRALVFQQSFVHAFLVPVVYQSLLDIHKRLHNPLTDVKPFNSSSYPYDSYAVSMKAEAASLSSGAQNIPLPRGLRQRLRKAVSTP